MKLRSRRGAPSGGGSGAPRHTFLATVAIAAGGTPCRTRRCQVLSGLCALLVTAPLSASSPFAVTVLDYDPAPGQLVNDFAFNDPALALGAPIGAGLAAGDTTSVVTLGGFGGELVLAFDHTVRDDPTNPLGLDAIVFGNAFYVAGDANRHWAEAAIVEISLDVNSNGSPDDPWYLIPGSHIVDPPAQFETQTWDDDIFDPTYPPSNPTWIPPGKTGTWTTSTFRLPSAIFEVNVVENPNGLGATDEGIFGYADFTPTLLLGDTDADDVVDDFSITPEEFYTVPDDPFAVGVSPGSGGGDAFDIAWAIDPSTQTPAGIGGFNFIRITNAVNELDTPVGELSTEIDAVADVEAGMFGDADGDGDIDLTDYDTFAACLSGPDGGPVQSMCRIMDFDVDSDVDLSDYARFSEALAGS